MAGDFADPFDVTQTNPDFYRNLLSFGLATMAAGSQPGATTLGALGRGGMAAMDAARSNANARAENQLRQQDVVSKQFTNANQLYNLNLTRGLMGLPPINFNGVPNLYGQSYENNNQPQVSSAPTDSNAALAQYRKDNNMETPPIDYQRQGMGLPNSAPAPNSGSGSWSPNAGMSPAGQSQRAQATSVMGMPVPTGMNPSDFKNSIIADRLGMSKVSELYQQPYLAGFKPIEARQGGISVIPNLGIKVTGRLEGESPGGAKYLTPPSITQYGHPLYGSPNGYENSPALEPSPAAVQVASSLPMPGNTQQQAAPPSAPREASFMPLQQEQPSQQPQIPQIAASSLQPNQPAPAVTSSNYAGVPSGSILTDIGPGAKQQIEDLMKFHADGEHGELKGYQAANQAQQNVEQLKTYINTLNSAPPGDSNFFTTGAGANARVELAKVGNTIAKGWGTPDDQLPFDPNKVGAGEGAYKMTNLLGMQMISQMFGAQREAANVIMTGIKSNPSIENTPAGARMLVNGIQEMNKNTMDRYSFKDWWSRADGPHPGDLRGADVIFNTAFPPQAYAQRAISLEKPINVNNPTARNMLLPGTNYIAPDGSKRVVPEMTPQQVLQRVDASMQQTQTAPTIQQGQ